jgi:hypothetical protein
VGVPDRQLTQPSITFLMKNRGRRHLENSPEVAEVLRRERFAAVASVRIVDGDELHLTSIKQQVWWSRPHWNRVLSIAARQGPCVILSVLIWAKCARLSVPI